MASAQKKLKITLHRHPQSIHTPMCTLFFITYQLIRQTLSCIQSIEQSHRKKDIQLFPVLKFSGSFFQFSFAYKPKSDYYKHFIVKNSRLPTKSIHFIFNLYRQMFTLFLCVTDYEGIVQVLHSLAASGLNLKSLFLVHVVRTDNVIN